MSKLLRRKVNRITRKGWRVVLAWGNGDLLLRRKGRTIRVYADGIIESWN
jgi:hypothetical protein